MGYEIDDVVVIEFDGRPGLEVRVRPMDTGEQLEMLRMRAQLRAGTVDAAVFFSDRLGAFAKHLESWTFERKGEPIPADLQGTLSLPLTITNDILKRWLDASAGEVDAPLPQGSPAGEPHQEESMTMEALSPSPEN